MTTLAKAYFDYRDTVGTYGFNRDWLRGSDRPVIVTGADLTRLDPNSFYFKGQSAPTQMRNTAAAKFGLNVM